ncbi:MAG TPA: 2Fe-2S iron-sulfur cluster-binding protein [Ideonella sp.]|uniref:2Fe-2S iron-sulfur cluster-binding protein n=1 Tax=Ideonella sp. TaxID=1929293 RepID=UPI002E36C274|nr:2Fe-2S iron-sulfur cluster-binding protein [Ideonella sp.]HEX5685015.1 2Fe-2S iron-sulfur cluster-binding protein [Ideonella sp.]
MTAAQLLAWIAAALLLQTAVGVGMVLWWRRGMVAELPAVPDHAHAPSSSGAAWAGWREFRVRARAYEDAARSQCSFYLEPVDGAALPGFKPGQFLTFSLDVPGDGRDAQGATRPVTRCYSLSDRPDPACYRITVKRVLTPADHPEWPRGVASNHLHDRVQVGDVVRVKAPSGHFFIDSDARVPAVLVAAGIGITPMMSMLRWCLAEQPGRRLHLVYGVRNGREHAFKLRLQEIAASHPKLTLTVAYSRPGPEDAAGTDFQHTGHVDVDLLRRILPHGRHQFYVCGPPAMMQSLVPALVEWGVPRADLHFEAFGPASIELPGAQAGAAVPVVSVPVEVRFSRSGRTLAWDGQDANLLEFAERHGVVVESGCRSGGCGSCETRLSSGAVHYASPPDHDIAPGHCLLCVGRPSSAVVLEA